MKIITQILIGLALTAASFAGEIRFDFKDPTGVSNLKIDMKAPLESIDGSADGIVRSIAFDPSNPGKTKGTIEVDTGSIMVPKSEMRDHIMSAMWMNAKKFPTMNFELSEIEGIAQSSDGVYNGKAKGSMTVRGVTKPLEADVTLRYLAGKLGAKIPGKEGDLLVVTGNLIVNRDRFDINAGCAQK